MGKVGIILVNYNGLEDTIDCLNSINKSTYKDYEIVIVDNNSEEKPDILSTYENVTLVKLYENVGFGIANNIGTQKAIDNGADYILCLNNDTEITDGLLALFVSEIKEREVLTCATYYFSDKKELWYGGGKISKIRGTCRQKKYKNSRYVSFICGCCMFFSKETFNEIGLFAPEYFMYCEDSDYSIKLLLNGYKIRYLYQAGVYHKVGKSISKEPGMKDYYLTRNRMFLLEKYSNYFYPSVWIYFYITRALMIIINAAKGYDSTPIYDGIRDFRKGKMYRK